MEEFSEQLIGKLKQQVKLGRLRKYIVGIRESQGIKTGGTTKDFGGGYRPTSSEQRLSGTYLLQWPDGNLSQGRLVRESLASFADFLSQAKATAFDDPFGDNFPKAKQHPEIEVFDKETQAAIQDPAKHLFPWAKKLRQWQDKINPHGSRTYLVWVGGGRSRIVSSAGFDLETRDTQTSLFSIYDDKTYLNHTSRALPDSAVIKAKQQRAKEYLTAINRSLTKRPNNGKMRLIFTPALFRNLLFELFLTNLSGKAVIEGSSKFELADFQEHKSVIREDLSLTCDPTQNGKVGAYNFTGEGVLSRPTTFIKKGRLVTPMLDCKYARQAQMTPTALVSPGMDTTTISAEGYQDLDSYIAKQKEALLIYDALGIHTQDPITGSYSLPCPYALWIKNGALVGNVPCTITGNFFTNLNDPETVFLRQEYEHPPALATTANVILTS